jgi:hypothetical protein
MYFQTEDLSRKSEMLTQFMTFGPHASDDRPDDRSLRAAIGAFASNSWGIDGWSPDTSHPSQPSASRTLTPAFAAD